MIKPIQVFEFGSNTPQLSQIVDLTFESLTTIFSPYNKKNLSQKLDE